MWKRGVLRITGTKWGSFASTEAIWQRGECVLTVRVTIWPMNSTHISERTKGKMRSKAVANLLGQQPISVPDKEHKTRRGNVQHEKEKKKKKKMNCSAELQIKWNMKVERRKYFAFHSTEKKCWQHVQFTDAATGSKVRLWNCFFFFTFNYKVRKLRFSYVTVSVQGHLNKKSSSNPHQGWLLWKKINPSMQNSEDFYLFFFPSFGFYFPEFHIPFSCSF